jgi:hypothetical protein
MGGLGWYEKRADHSLCRVDKMGCIKRIMEEQNGTIFLCNRRQHYIVLGIA